MDQTSHRKYQTTYIAGHILECIGYSFTDKINAADLQVLDNVESIGTLIGISLFERTSDNKHIVLGYFLVGEPTVEDISNANADSISDYFAVLISI
jgi:hypothetical protein